MSNDLDMLFNEAKQFFNDKEYENAKEILEVLVSSEYLAAYEMLSQVYKSLGEFELSKETLKKLDNVIKPQNSNFNTVKNSSIKATNESRSFVANPKVSIIENDSIKPYYQTYSNNNTFQSRKKSIIFDPSNEVWLNIVLYSSIFLELLLLIASFYFAVHLENILYFLLGCIAIVLMHLITMVTLNLSFNVQSIKEDLKELKNGVKQNSKNK